MKTALTFAAGFLLAGAIAAGMVWSWVVGVRSGVASCPECEVCEEGVGRPSFSAPDPLEAGRAL